MVAAALVASSQATIANERVQLTRDIPFATHGGVTLRLDSYLPADDLVHPGIVLIHGGAWSSGDKEDLGELATTFTDHGFAAFSINYRLVPQWPYPAPVEDVVAAVSWLREHATQFRLDPKRIGAFGGSAGGYLAAMLATSGRGSLTTGGRVAAAASWSGPMDLVPLLSAVNPVLPGAVLSLLGCGEPTACVAAARDASPIHYVDAMDTPMLIANATREVIPIDQAVAMSSAYRSVGVSFELLKPDNTEHGLHNMAELLQPTLAFFGRFLGGPGRRAELVPISPERSPLPSPSPRSTVPRPTGVPPRSTGDDRGGSPAAPGEPLMMLVGVLVVVLGASQLAVALRASRMIQGISERNAGQSSHS
jgi:acetyl esterase